MLWVDKHRPATLDKLDYHPELTQRLQRLADTGDLPHLLFCGPPGAGKKTRIMALLRAVFGPGAQRLRLEHKTFEVGASNKKIDITTIASNYHIEINPGEAGYYDREVVTNVIKEMAQYHPLEASQKSFKVLLLLEVDRLSKNAQAALRRTMEKYSATCRLILCCNSASKVIEPIRSRCLTVRVPAPSTEQICTVLTNIARKETIQLPAEFGMRVAKLANRNLRRATLCLEACRVKQYPFTADQEVELLDWEKFIGSLARDITQEQSPARLMLARGKLYELLTNCIPADVILKTLNRELMHSLDDELKHEVTNWAAYYEHRLQLGSKEIYHLEAFIAKFMSLYRQFLVDFYG